MRISTQYRNPRFSGIHLEITDQKWGDCSLALIGTAQGSFNPLVTVVECVKYTWKSYFDITRNINGIIPGFASLTGSA